MLEKKDEQYLVGLISQAKTKCKEQYDIELKKDITINMDKNLEENKALIIQAIKSERDLKLKDKPKIVARKNNSEEKKKLAEQKSKEEAVKIKQMKLEEDKVIADWKKQFNPSMIIQSPAYFEMEKYIEMVCDGFSNFCIIASEGGLAKTWSSQAILHKKQIDYAYLNSFTSPLELYNFLYDNQQDKVILIDDTEGIWDNRAIISILKNATELNGTRTISWNSTTSKLGDRNNKCQFTSKIILLTNQVPNTEKNPHIQALVGRAFLCELNFSYREKMDIMAEVSKKKYQNLTDEERTNIFDFVKRNTNEATQDLSIRTLIKCYHFYMFDKKIWQELGLKILKADPRRETILKLMESEKMVNDQIKVYTEATGHSRADFFRIKKELMPKTSRYPKAKV